MDNFPSQTMHFLVVILLMGPGLVALAVHNYLHNTKTAILSALASVPLSILVFRIYLSNQADGIERLGTIITGVLGIPIIYLIVAPSTFLLASVAYYVYIKYWD